MKIDVIILAAGESVRFGSQKQDYLFQNQQTMWQIIVNKLLLNPWINNIIIIRNRKLKVYSDPKYCNIKWTIGGDTRTQSMANGLKLVTAEKVIVHDGARPFLSSESWNNFINEAKNCSNLICASKILNSVKQIITSTAKGIPIKIKTVNRNKFLTTETPQMFETKTLRCAIKRLHNSASYIDDELQLVNCYCPELKLQPIFFFHNDLNEKITYCSDVSKYSNWNY